VFCRPTDKTAAELCFSCWGLQRRMACVWLQCRAPVSVCVCPCSTCHAFPPVQLCSRREQCAATAAPVRSGSNRKMTAGGATAADSSLLCSAASMMMMMLGGGGSHTCVFVGGELDTSSGLVRVGVCFVVLLWLIRGLAPVGNCRVVIAALKWPSRGCGAVPFTPIPCLAGHIHVWTSTF
jgi:hypothetical protein